MFLSKIFPLPKTSNTTSTAVTRINDSPKVSNALHKAFNPKKVNYGAYGDTGCHLHFHLVPKYEGGDEYGGVFQMNPGKIFLSDAEYSEMIEKIKANL